MTNDTPTPESVTRAPATAEPATLTLTIAETAEQLRVGRDFVYDAINRGDIAAFNISGGTSREKLRIRAADLDAYLASRRVVKIG